MLGTTDYVSPEQALGREVTQQSDIYSLGIVLYEMLAGEAPFQGDTQVAVAMKHVRSRCRTSRLRRPEVSAALAAVVDRATAKETGNRYATVDEMVRDLEEVLAIEAARTGEATGEATTVLRTLPSDTADFAPARLRHPRRALAMGALRSRSPPPRSPSSRRVPRRAPGGTAAPDSSPLSAVREQRRRARLRSEATWRRPRRRWSTRSTGIQRRVGHRDLSGRLESNDKSGVGLYVDARDPVAARELSS